MRLAKPFVIALACLSTCMIIAESACSSDDAASPAAADGGADSATARAYRCTGKDLEYCAVYGTEVQKPPTTTTSCGSRETCKIASNCFPISCTCNGTVTKINPTCNSGCCLDLATTCKSVCAGNGVPDSGGPTTTTTPSPEAGTICALWVKQDTCITESDCHVDTERCGCDKRTCASVGANCGSIDDHCGGKTACGACSGTDSCGGGGSPNTCGCTPGPTSTPALEAGKGENLGTIGTRTWDNTNGIGSPDGDGGTSSTGAAEVSAMTSNQVSNWLLASTFNVDVPPSATVQGVEFTVVRSALSGVGIADNAVRLLKAGNVETTDRAKPGGWTDTLESVTYGGPTDLWGTTVTASDVRDGGFGLALSTKYTSTAGNDWPRVERVRVKVYFTVTCN